MCIELYPDDLKGTPPAIVSRFNLAKAFDKLGQKDKAIEHLNQALDMERQVGGLTASDLAEAKTLLTRLQEGK